MAAASVPSTTQSHTPVTLTLWSAYTGPENDNYEQAMKMFEQQYPWITVNHVGNMTPQNIQQAINGGIGARRGDRVGAGQHRRSSAPSGAYRST